MKLLEVKNLKVFFPIKDKLFGKPTKFVKAVNNVSFEVERGEIFSIVGESGSGKSTIALALMGIHERNGGSIIFNGAEVNQEDFKTLRRKIQIVFQDPDSSLDPRKRIKDIIAEGLRVHRVGDKAFIDEKVRDIVEKVGLTVDTLRKYPHELSGGQKQRVGIARALVLEPELIILDEPTASLDVSIQAQILNLLVDLQEALGLTYILITHDLKLVEHISDRTLVMYLGKVMEMGETKQIMNKPLHPYTKALIDSVPVPNPEKRNENEEILTGEIPSPLNPPEGCPFKTRCKYRMELCSKEPKSIKLENRVVFCHLYESKNLEV
ncbi:MAG: ATP-binding cassette domain-containing protein [Thermotogae bacterium]|nr:ATP-binding cassette domain-containing protein [Thermotogota bacterium]